MALKIGDRAPAFKLPGDGGKTYSLAEFKGKQVILYFYPKDDTPGCTRQACGFRDNYAAIQKAGAVVLGISPNSIQDHVKFKKKHNLNFPLLSDPDHKVTEMYGAWGERSMYGKKFMGVIRSHVVIDAQGKIADLQIKVSPEVSVTRAVEQVTA